MHIVGALYYLSRDENQVKFESTTHTLKFLLEVLDDLYYEYACGYVHYLNIINNMKEKNEFNP